MGRQGGGTDRPIVKCSPKQGRDGYKRVDIISSDTHCVADSLCRSMGLEALLELI